MAQSKTAIFPARTQRISALAKAISHPARIEILRLLAEQNACICGDLVTALPLSQATVSQHLKALKEVGLIQGEVDGPRVCYCIDPHAWAEAAELLGGFFQEITKQNTCNC